ncbi:MAG TPA: patatin-like phospholipase family protein [Thermoanaerobaculia bacterium]|jgi:hypothetical protein
MPRYFLLVVSIALAGCAAHIRLSQPSVQGPVDDPTPRVAANQKNVKCSYEPEWAYNRSGATDGPPQLGVALSGGGMRAAAYAVGALQGLSNLGYLEKTDVLSGVSGGAYATGWYISQRAAADVTDADLFDNAKPYQHHLEDHGKIVNGWRLTRALVADTALFPVNLLVNGMFGWHANTTGHRYFYESALVNEFFTKPGEHRRLRYTFDELRAASQEKKLPLFIINTTAYIDDDSHHYAADTRNTVYEFTQVRYGSDAYGYLSSDYPIDLPTAVSVSGAAADSNALQAGAVQKTLLSGLNFDLGYFVDNRLKATMRVDQPCVTFKPESKAGFYHRKWSSRLIPFPVYAFLPYWAKDQRGVRTYLSDGGHSENLGAFSLIRRLVKNIVIVDASGDSHFEFSDYLQLKNAVLQSLNANLEVKAIDEVLSKPENERRRRISQDPVMTGEVRYFPYPGESDERRILKIVYVKLSYDKENDDKYKMAGFSNINAYAGSHMKFPFHGLLDQSYSTEQYRAYRDLAFVTITNGKEILKASMPMK